MSFFLQAVNFHPGIVEGLDICVALGKLHVHGVPAFGDGQHYQSCHAVPQAVNLHLGENPTLKPPNLHQEETTPSQHHLPGYMKLMTGKLMCLLPEYTTVVC